MSTRNGAAATFDADFGMFDDPPESSATALQPAPEDTLDADLDARLRDARAAASLETHIEWAHAQLKAHGITKDGEGRTARKELFFESALDLLDRDFPEQKWRIHRMLKPDSLAGLSGEPKTAKTWSAEECAMAIATGTPAFGAYATQEPAAVALFLAEDEQRNTRARLCSLARGRGMEPKAALKNIHFNCRSSIDVMDLDDLVWLLASVHAIPEPVALLVLDPLRDVHSGEENDSGEMARVMRRLRAVRDICGCSVLFVHHTAKANRDNKSSRAGQRMRGSSAVHGAIDAGIHFVGATTDGQSKWSATVEVEVKAGKGAGRFSLVLDVVDKDEEAHVAKWTVGSADVTAAVGRHAAKILAVLAAAGAPLSQNEIVKRARGKREDVIAAVHELHRSGEIEHGMVDGGSSGFVLTKEKSNGSGSSPTGGGTGNRHGEPEGNHQGTGSGNHAEPQGTAGQTVSPTLGPDGHKHPDGQHEMWPPPITSAA